MNDPLQLILQQAGLKSNYFAPSSRYFGIEAITMEARNQGTIAYVRRRFIPQPDGFQLLQEHVATENERLDNITHRYLSDPEQFWRICDANGVIDPNELTNTIGKKVRITLPEGISGTKSA